MDIFSSSLSNRLVVYLFGPALLGSLIVCFIGYIESVMQSPANLLNLWEMILGFLFVSIYALLFVGFQSIFYTLIMETVVRKWLRWRIVFALASGSLGALAGSVLPLGGTFQFPVLGFFVGCILGVLTFQDELTDD